MAKMLSSPTRQSLCAILQAQTGDQVHYRLVGDMQNTNTPEQFEQNLELLEALNRGLHGDPFIQ